MTGKIKLSDQELEKLADKVINAFFTDGVDIAKPLINYFKNYDPWYYISNGELPKLGAPNNLGFRKSDEVFLLVHNDDDDDEYDTGWLVEYRENNYYWELMHDHEIGCKFRDNCELKYIYCWQPIIKPYK